MVSSRLFSNKVFLLSILLILHIGFWIIRKPPQPSSDDLVYFQNAKSLLSGEYHLNDSPKNHRLVVFGPVALLTSVFGESPWVISLWPLICSCITLTFLFLFLSKYSSLLHGFASGLLLASNTLQIDYSDSLFPDVIVAMFAFLFLAEIYKARKKNGGHWYYVIVATLFFYLGFLAKEIIIFVLPFTLILLIQDLKGKNNLGFWKKFIPLMIVSGLLLNTIYYFITGEVNFIYHSVNTRHSEFYTLQTGSEIIKRFTYQPAVMFVENVGYVILFLLALHFSIALKLKNLGLNDVTNFFIKYLLVLLAIYWFVPISFNHLALIQLDPRMWMLLLSPLYILAGYSISKIISDWEIALKLLAIIFLLASIAAFIFVSPQRALMFLSFALSAVMVFMLRGRFVEKILLVIILLLPAIVLALRFTTANSNF